MCGGFGRPGVRRGAGVIPQVFQCRARDTIDKRGGGPDGDVMAAVLP